MIQPMTFGEQMDGSFRIYRKHFWLLWLFSIIVTAPLTFFSDWLLLYQYPTEKSIFSSSTLQIIGYLCFITFLSMAFVYPLILSLSVQLTQTEEHAVRKRFRLIFRSLGKVITANLCISLICFLVFGFFILVIGLPLYSLFQSEGNVYPEKIWTIFFICTIASFFPIVYLYIRYSLVTPIYLFENASFLYAFKRSWKLTKGHFLIIFGVYICLTILSVPFDALLWGINELILSSSLYPIWLWQGIYLLLSIVITALFYPLIPIYVGLSYWNFRSRKEAYDIQVQLEQVVTSNRKWR